MNKHARPKVSLTLQRTIITALLALVALTGWAQDGRLRELHGPLFRNQPIALASDILNHDCIVLGEVLLASSEMDAKLNFRTAKLNYRNAKLNFRNAKLNFRNAKLNFRNVKLNIRHVICKSL